jgi:predicted RNA binding protein YcfA (HicA-like mRNA interferase family)
VFVEHPDGLAMAKVETNTRLVIDRLSREGWLSEGGTNHEKFGHPSQPGDKIMVPRHRTLSPGVARSIARAAGW